MNAAEKKDAYRAKCREFERQRREALGLPEYPLAKPAKQRRARRDRTHAPKPVYGSAEWCETYQDDLGESPDRCS